MEANALPLVMIADNIQQIREESAAGSVGDSVVNDMGWGASRADAGDGDGDGGGAGSNDANCDSGESATDWAARQISHFNQARNAVAAYREHVEVTRRKDMVSTLPHSSDHQGWKRLCYGRGQASSSSTGTAGSGDATAVCGGKEGRSPLTSFVGGFPQSLVSSEEDTTKTLHTHTHTHTHRMRARTPPSFDDAIATICCGPVSRTLTP